MSYQTVADIFAGSQNNFDYQKKDLLKADASTSSTSFNDLVSFYKNESSTSKTETSSEYKRPEDVNKNNENKYEEKTEDVKNTSEEVKSEKTETSEEVKENTSEEATKAEDIKKEDSENKTSKKKVENSDVEKNTENKKNLDLPELISKAEDGKEDKKSVDKKVKDTKGKKLSNKDFSRMHELTAKSESSPATEVAVASEAKNLKVKDNSKDSKEEKNIKNIASNLKSKDSSDVKENDEKELKTKVKDDNDNAQLASLISENEKNVKEEDIKNLKDFDKEDALAIADKNPKDKVYMDKDNKIVVEDLRTNINVAEADSTESKLKVSEPKLTNENTATMSIDLRQNVTANVTSSNSQTAAANGSTFQSMLNNQIQQSAPEFVKAGNLILKDNDQGTINLLLRPDELGNVKLHLSLDGKNISGHITVATKEAFEVFKDNAETLREAFIKSGFDAASFDVSYGGNNPSGQQMDFEQQQDGTSYVAKRVYGSNQEGTDQEFDKIVEKNDHNKEYSINIVA